MATHSTFPDAVTRSPERAPTARPFVPQAVRLLFAAIYVVSLVLVARASVGWPELDPAGTWFWAGALLILLTSAFTEPFFSTPGDSVANGAAAVVAAIAFSSEDVSVSASTLSIGRALVAGFGAVIVTSGLVVIIASHDRSSRTYRSPLFARFRQILGSVGSARTIYSVLYLTSSYAVFSDDAGAVACLWGAWIVIFVVRPLERLYRAWPVRHGKLEDAVATVTSLRDPGLVELDAVTRSAMNRGERLRVGEAEVEVLDTSHTGSGTWALAAVTNAHVPGIGDVATKLGTAPMPGLGYVDAGTTLDLLRFATPAAGVELDYGDLVAVQTGGREILYQVVAAEIRATRLDSTVSHSSVSVDAARLGSWNRDEQRFERAGWLPAPGSVVRKPIAPSGGVSVDAIGRVAGTDLPVYAELEYLVTHGTAVFGVLGSGKSTFAKELVRRVALSGCKVLVIDSTNEYEIDLYDVAGDSTDSIAESINSEIAGTAEAVDSAEELGGNRAAFSQAIRQDLREFLSSNDDVRIYDLTKFKVRRQLKWPDKRGDAPFGDCTLPELAAIVSEAALELLAGELRHGAQLWVVLEEGHRLVPEFSAISAKDDDKHAQRVAKVFLQGRKHGLGVLLITQRTANVSKSLVTQCNTVFCFRAHDDTTANFLRERAGASHTKALPNLLTRRLLAFGRGIGCEDPLFLTVNETETITELLRAPRGDRRQREEESVSPADQICGCTGSVGNVASSPELMRPGSASEAQVETPP